MRLRAGAPWRALRRALAAGAVAAGLALSAAPPVGGAIEAGATRPQPQPGTPGTPGTPVVTMTDLPTGVDWSGINDRGQLLGITGGADRRLVLWEDGRVTDIGPYEQPSRPDCPPVGFYCPLPGPLGATINDRGQIGISRDGRAALWDDGVVTTVDGDAESSWLVGLDQRGQALVVGARAGRHVLGLWSRGTFTEITALPVEGRAAWTAQLSDGGHVVVSRVDFDCSCVNAFLWHRGTRTDLGPYGGAVNRRGQIAGTTADPATGEWHPFVWERGRVTRLPTLGGQTGVEDINDRGQVLGYSYATGENGSHTVLWDGGEIVDIGARIDGHDSPVGLNERGQVLVQGGMDAARRAHLWDRGGLVTLPPLEEPSIVEAHGFNDRGQIYGRRSTGLLGPSVPTLWRVRRR